MSKLLFLFFLCCLLPPLKSFMCDKILDSNAFFSLNPLISLNDFTYDYAENNIRFRLYYSFCGLTVKTCNGVSAYALQYRLDSNGNEVNSSCIKLSSSSTLSNFAYTLNNPDDASNGIQLTLLNGDIYSISMQGQVNYQAIFKVFCDKSNLPVPFLIDEITNDQNQYLIIGRSLAGCPIVENSPVYQFIVDNQIPIGIIMIIVGIFECFLGLAIIKETIFFVGFLGAFGFLMMIFGEFILDSSSGVFASWLLILISVLVGTLIGYISTSLPKIGFMCLGFWIGFVMGFIINNLFLYKVTIDPPGLLLYVIMGMFGLIFAFISACLWRHICIVGTSFLGAYLVIRVLSLWIGSYPNELSVPKQIKFKEIPYVDWQFYIYFIGLMILTTMGMILQFRNKRKIGGRFAGKYYEDLMDDDSAKGSIKKEKSRKKSGKFDDINGKNEKNDMKKTESDKELKFSSSRNPNNIEIQMEENGENGENNENDENYNNNHHSRNENIEGDIENQGVEKKKKKKRKKKHHHSRRNDDDDDDKKEDDE